MQISEVNLPWNLSDLLCMYVRACEDGKMEISSLYLQKLHITIIKYDIGLSFKLYF